MNEDQTAQVCRDLGYALAKLEVYKDDAAGIRIAKIHTAGNFTVLDLAPYEHRASPTAIREKVDLQDAGSFIEYVEKFKTEGSRIFFDNDPPKFVAVLDYSDGSPQWGEHVASFAPRKSEEWKLWFERNTKYFGQVAFGRFIEENSIDVQSPDGATLLEMVTTFEATKSIAMREVTRLKNNQVQFSWVEDIKTGSVDIPDRITIRIPVFYNQKPKDILLRFRYNIDEQKLKLAYEFERPERTRNDACAELVQQVRSETGLPVHMGKRNPLK